MDENKLKSDSVGKRYNLSITLPNGENVTYQNAELVKEDGVGKTFMIDSKQEFWAGSPDKKCFIAIYPQNISILAAVEVE